MPCCIDSFLFVCIDSFLFVVIVVCVLAPPWPCQRGGVCCSSLVPVSAWLRTVLLKKGTRNCEENDEETQTDRKDSAEAMRVPSVLSICSSYGQCGVKHSPRLPRFPRVHVHIIRPPRQRCPELKPVASRHRGGRSLPFGNEDLASPKTLSQESGQTRLVRFKTT